MLSAYSKELLRFIQRRDKDMLVEFNLRWYSLLSLARQWLRNFNKNMYVLCDHCYLMWRIWTFITQVMSLLRLPLRYLRPALVGSCYLN